MTSLSKQGGCREEDFLHRFYKSCVSSELFYSAAVAVGPIFRKNQAGYINALVIWIGPDKLRKEGKILLEQIDMKKARGMVAVPKDLMKLGPVQLGGIFPLLEQSVAFRFLGKIPPPLCQRR